jgi:hypothetical protein
MDNSINKNHSEKIEEIVIFVSLLAGLLFMVIYWK